MICCFVSNLETFVAAPEARLALYLLNGNNVLVDKLGTPFVYYSGPEEQLSKYIKLKTLNGPEGPDLPTTCLRVCLICHNVADCKETKAELAHHLQSGMLGCHQSCVHQTDSCPGCATKIILERNSTFTYLPILSGCRTELVTPTVPTSPSPAKRPRHSGPGRSVPPSNLSSQLSTPIASTSLTSTPLTTYAVPPELDKGKCVITGFDSSWGPLIAGPGIETCYIIPKALSAWYGYPDMEMSTQQ